MSSALSNTIRRYLTPISAGVIGLTAAGNSSAGGDDRHHHMTLRSTTFADGGTLPLSMINTISNASGQNTCTASGADGGNASPQLTWEHAPHDTKSFVVIAYDVSAEFTHWQMYNIPASTNSLPDNAGTSGSIYGLQNGNDFFVAQYSGPCPPMGVMPLAHEYVFTVYALDTFLPVVPVSSSFFSPAGPEGLYQELIDAGLHGHILEKASIAGFFSSTPSN